jgi:hypothetical protein
MRLALTQGGAQAKALAQPARQKRYGSNNPHSYTAENRHLRIAPGLEQVENQNGH